MNNYKKYGMVALVVIISGMGLASTFALGAKDAAPAAAPAAKTADANAVVDTGWSERCNSTEKKPNKNTCEVFTRLEMKASNMRVAEVAIGFPQDETLPKGTARGVIILPLGVMLQPGATMAVDDGKPFAFSSKFCTQSGCFSIVNLNKDILGTMKKGKYLNIFFKTAENHDAHLAMSLGSFKKEISKIE